jgi:hypothetical protein
MTTGKTGRSLSSAKNVFHKLCCRKERLKKWLLVPARATCAALLISDTGNSFIFNKKTEAVNFGFIPKTNLS